MDIKYVTIPAKYGRKGSGVKIEPNKNHKIVM